MDSLLIANLIWTGALGLAVGNYATSFIYRTPKGESPFTKHPYCGGCGTMLAVKDLFPALSWLMLKGKCRYCDMVIPAVYFWTELCCAIIFMAGIASYGWTESYLLLVAGGTVGVVLWGLEARTEKIYYHVLLILAAIGLMYRILLDGTIYSALDGLFLGAGIPMAYWRLTIDPENLNGEKSPLAAPPAIALGATAGVWLAPLGLLVFIILWGISALVCRAVGQPYVRTAPYLFALIVVLLYPSGIEALEKTLIERLILN